jgi:O-antigen/teichoic acid export membrane protein
MGMNIEKLKKLILSSTAKDTFVLFAGNLGSAFWGFVFTLITARALSVSDFGVFSATLNLMIIITSLADFGISSGAVNFVSIYDSRGDNKKVDQYIKASFVTRFLIAIVLSLLIFAFSKVISIGLLATTDTSMAIWAGILPIFLFPDMLFPFILQAKKKFLQSTIYDNAFYIARLAVAFVYYMIGGLTISKAFWAFGAGFLINIILTLFYIGTKFLKSKATKEEYLNLMKFSGWIGVNRVVSSVSGKLDVQMLAALSGALVTGLYSIPSRLASFIIVLSGRISLL